MNTENLKEADIIIVGAGAAGLMAAIWAGRTNPQQSIVVLDTAKKLGAKILIAGGGRCNVTHHEVNPNRYAGSTRPAIARVLQRFDVSETVRFFSELGVTLKRESTGKLFPTSNKARDVLDALLTAARDANVNIYNPRRVDRIGAVPTGFFVAGDWGRMECRKLVIATGGKSLPKSGSDGKGIEFARSFGHQPTRNFPALVPLTLQKDDEICQLSGVTVPATIRLHSGTGKCIIEFTDSTLCTHFGLSGPSILDISRYYLDLIFEDPKAYLSISWFPGKSKQGIDEELQTLGNKSVFRYLQSFGLPERMLKMLCRHSGVDIDVKGAQLQRKQRQRLAQSVIEMRLGVTGDRGYNFAEVTAGGIPLSELFLKRMESRCHPGLFVCGEVCDVDGPIGGFNFQWAWASGYVAGTASSPI